MKWIKIENTKDNAWFSCRELDMKNTPFVIFVKIAKSCHHLLYFLDTHCTSQRLECLVINEACWSSVCQCKSKESEDEKSIGAKLPDFVQLFCSSFFFTCIIGESNPWLRSTGSSLIKRSLLIYIHQIPGDLWSGKSSSIIIIQSYNLAGTKSHCYSYMNGVLWPHALYHGVIAICITRTNRENINLVRRLIGIKCYQIVHLLFQIAINVLLEH